MTFSEQAKATGDRLGATGHCTQGSFLIKPASRPLVWSKFPRRHRDTLHRVPADFFALYQEIDYAKAGWECIDPGFSSAIIVGRAYLSEIHDLFVDRLGFATDHGYTDQLIWDDLPPEQLARYEGYYIFDSMTHSTYTVWRQGPERVELALYLRGQRLHALPFTPLQYLETGLALGFVELWQLLFIAPAEQAEYAHAIGTVLGQVQYLFPDGLALVPAHVRAQFAPPPRPAAPDYRQLFAHTQQRLAAVPGLQLLRARLPKAGASLGSVERVRRELGRPLPDELRAFYEQINGCELSWQLPATASEPAAEGRLALWPLERVFGGENWMSVKHWDETINDGVLWGEHHADHVPGLKGLRPFDDQGESGYPSFRLAADPAAPASLYLVGSFDLDYVGLIKLSFAQYLARAFAGGAVKDWQVLFLPEYRDTGTDPPEEPAVRQAWARLGVDPAPLLA